MLCYAMLCYAMLCYAMLCYAMLCYATPYFTILYAGTARSPLMPRIALTLSESTHPALAPAVQKTSETSLALREKVGMTGTRTHGSLKPASNRFPLLAYMMRCSLAIEELRDPSPGWSSFLFLSWPAALDLLVDLFSYYSANFTQSREAEANAVSQLLKPCQHARRRSGN